MSEAREMLIEDRTRAHADHVGQGFDRHTTAAVGVLKAVHCGEKYACSLTTICLPSELQGDIISFRILLLFSVGCYMFIFICDIYMMYHNKNACNK